MRTVIHKAWFHKHLLDYSIINKHAVAPRPFAKAKIVFLNKHSHFAGEVTVSIWKHENIFNSKLLCPLVHDESIVYAETNYFINSGRFEIFIVIVVAWQVSARAGWSKGTWK